MKERPILFSTPMIQAILDGRKTQTRRIVKHISMLGGPDKWCNKLDVVNRFCGDYKKYCHYGNVKDRLWVRETTEADENTSDSVVLSRYTADKKPVLYSGCEDPEFNGSVAHWDYPRKVRPSIHMQRWASRILLEITDIKVERIQDISEDDAKAEGIEAPFKVSSLENNKINESLGYRWQFSKLWYSINEKSGYGWEVNPWVWAISFKVLEVRR